VGAIFGVPRRQVLWGNADQKVPALVVFGPCIGRPSRALRPFATGYRIESRAEQAATR
jgi:hypothetical protein